MIRSGLQMPRSQASTGTFIAMDVAKGADSDKELLANFLAGNTAIGANALVADAEDSQEHEGE